jgi:type I restriction enzyme S subunit
LSVALGSICRFLNGGTPDKSVPRYFEGDNPWITSADITGPIASDARSFISDEAITKSATNKVPKDAVLLVTRTGVGKVAVAGRDLCISQDITALLPDQSKVAAGYLIHFLRTKKEHFVSVARGATIKGITRDVVADLAVPLPPLPEQRRIAAILDQADALRAKLREALAQLDSLTQSIFIEMFGNPVRNPKGWQRIALGELLSAIDSGWSPVCLDRPVLNGEWGVLKLGAITSCSYDSTANKALPDGVTPDPSIEVKPGDLLFSRKNTYELVAACAYVEQTMPRLMMSDLIFRLQVDDETRLAKHYLHALLTNAAKRQEVQKLAGGSSGSMPNVSKARLRGLLIELPPIDLQQTFATRIQAVESLKATHRAARAELDALFASLQHRAFAGQL